MVEGFGTNESFRNHCAFKYCVLQRKGEDGGEKGGGEIGEISYRNLVY